MFCIIYAYIHKILPNIPENFPNMYMYNSTRVLYRSDEYFCSLRRECLMSVVFYLCFRNSELAMQRISADERVRYLIPDELREVRPQHCQCSIFSAAGRLLRNSSDRMECR